MIDLHSFLEEAIYGADGRVEDDLGVDPDRVPVRDGVSILIDAVVSWLEQTDIVDEFFTVYLATNEKHLPSRAMNSIRRRLISLALRETE